MGLRVSWGERLDPGLGANHKNRQSRTEAAKIGGVGLQIIPDWVLRFNPRGSDGLLDGKSPGQRATLEVTISGIWYKPCFTGGLLCCDSAGDVMPTTGGSGALGAGDGSCAPAAGRSGAMDLRGVLHHHRQADVAHYGRPRPALEGLYRSPRMSVNASRNRAVRPASLNFLLPSSRWAFPAMNWACADNNP